MRIETHTAPSSIYSDNADVESMQYYPGDQKPAREYGSVPLVLRQHEPGKCHKCLKTTGFVCEKCGTSLCVSCASPMECAARMSSAGCNVCIGRAAPKEPDAAGPSRRAAKKQSWVR